MDAYVLFSLDPGRAQFIQAIIEGTPPPQTPDDPTLQMRRARTVRALQAASPEQRQLALQIATEFLDSQRPEDYVSADFVL